jgi:hypothetical protein
MRMLLSIAATLMVSGVAHAGFNATPPKGWKGDEGKVVTEQQLKITGAEGQKRTWVSANGDGLLDIEWTVLPPFEGEMTTAQLTDAAADVYSDNFVKSGAKLTSKVKARDVKGQLVAERSLRGKSTRIFVVQRALKAATGELQMLTIICYDRAEASCKKAAASAVLTAL